jgi:hypothetical protein
MDGLIDWLRTADLWYAVAVLLLENLLIFGLAVALGAWLVRRYASRPVALTPHPLDPAREIHDLEGRPFKICDGEPIAAIL